ncbi:hypothetical protein [Candidatus Avelusimicrobium fimicolum]|uniref:hypothetical protein n=1 Tax=Candidatus Avelusimicrobium fimicolum TaxID=3416216 RepID=UPI003D0CAD47
MKEFIDVSRAATCASVVILESCSPESVVAKRRDSVQKPYGMTFVWGGRTVKPILSSPKVSVGELFLLKKENDRFWTTTFGNDYESKNGDNGFLNPAGRTLAGRQFLGDDGLTTSGRTARAFVKRLVVLFLITLFAAVNAPAEIISAVSYNPSRMGDYVYLKVADKANLKGGIEANTMTVRSGGTVSASSPNLNYNVPAVVGESGSALDMPNTAIHGAAANTYDNYQAVNTGTPTALLNNVYVNGGTTTVKSDSYISTLDAVNRLKQKAATLRANKLSVSGSEDASLYDEATTDGFTLSGNDIPQPTSSHVNTGARLSNCTLKWEERTTSDNKKVKLLALANCNGSSAPETGDCSNSTYKAAHKSECCPSAAKTDTVCYSPVYTYVTLHEGLYDKESFDDDCGPTDGICAKVGFTCYYKFKNTNCATTPVSQGDRQTRCHGYYLKCQDSGEYKQLW